MSKQLPPVTEELIQAMRVTLGLNAQPSEERREARREARVVMRKFLEQIGRAPKRSIGTLYAGGGEVGKIYNVRITEKVK